MNTCLTVNSQHKGVAYKIDPCDTTHCPQGYADLCQSAFLCLKLQNDSGFVKKKKVALW